MAGTCTKMIGRIMGNNLVQTSIRYQDDDDDDDDGDDRFSSHCGNHTVFFFIPKK